MIPSRTRRRRLTNISITAFLIVLAFLLIYWKTPNLVDNHTESERFSKIIIGDLGGMKANIPVYHAQFLEYEGDAGWKADGRPERKNRTYESRIASFGTEFRYPDMTGLSSVALWEDKWKYKDEETPWVSLTILSGPNYPGNGFLNRLTQRISNGEEKNWPYNFEKQAEKQFELDLYILPGMSTSGDMPAREVAFIGADRYVYQIDGQTITYIECNNSKYASVRCQQIFSMEHDGLRIEGRILYRRSMLKNWKEMQEKTKKLILSWKAH